MQEPLFFESVYDAIRHLVAAAGGPKKVASMLWPNKSAAVSHTYMLNCLDANRAEKFGPDELCALRRLGRQIGCHALANWEAMDSGYESPKPVNSEEQARRLVDVIAQQQAQLQAAMTAFQQLAQQNPTILKMVG